uniref:hypothetical protein n=1 Tax=Pantoea sp. IMH TaxID=1267600 RepID=UPI0004B68173|nr:hypothetical protein [Pantoea sp. IMH]
MIEHSIKNNAKVKTGPYKVLSEYKGIDDLNYCLSGTQGYIVNLHDQSEKKGGDLFHSRAGENNFYSERSKWNDK